MRPIWKGAISFGMVTIPISLYSATEDKDVRFHLIHQKDNARIEQKRFCSAENVEVPWDEVVRGVETPDGDYIPVDPAEVEAVEPETAHTIEIGDFVELADVDPIYFEKTYFLEPSNIGAKPYLLLKRALEETGRIAVARVAIRTKERLATIRPYDGALALETMYWPDEIRTTADLDIPQGAKVEPSAREMTMARSLVENLSGKFDPDQYQDRYRIALEELIERKLNGEVAKPRRRPKEAPVTDLMAALEASVKAAQRARKEQVAAGGAPRRAASEAKREGDREREIAEGKRARRRKSAA